MCVVGFVVGTVIAWVESVVPKRPPSARRRRVLGSIAVLLAVAGALAGGLTLSHGHPVRFISRQWHGFAHQGTVHSGSHFTDLGSGRYDFWRVALDGFIAHPVGGLGQDNFDNYYVPRRRTAEEPSWTHSLELRLLAHTGLVGTALFAVFLIAAIAAFLRPRRRGGFEAAVSGVALLPFIVWLIYGSVDWFWEVPALSGAALGFLGVAAALGSHPPALAAETATDDTTSAPDEPPETAGRAVALGRLGPGRAPRGSGIAAGALGVLALVAAVVVLGFPYLSVRETSIGSDLGVSDPARALHTLSIAADLNPLSPEPSRLAGVIALGSQRYGIARQRFEQVISRNPGGWYGWFGAGLAASALGDQAQARRDFRTAASINPRNPVIARVLADVDTPHPLSPATALDLLARSL
jgi:cbb3-type cytochrome oxidase subunit 3